MNPTPFGTLPGGDCVYSYTLANANGLSVKVMTYGATVTSLIVPNHGGRLNDVVLGFDGLDGYLGEHPYFGAIVGRVAGRISGARFVLDGKVYELAPNEPPNHLHGGRVGFNRRLWEVAAVNDRDGAESIRLTYRSPDGEEGYPGTVDAAVTYTLTPDNALVVETEATSDQATPFSPTQHSYFNLAGEGAGTIEGHELQVLSDTFAPVDESLRLLGRRESVSGINDFNQPRRIGDCLPYLHKSHGDLYFVRNRTSELAPIARLNDSFSGRVLDVSTTEPCMQLYSGAFIEAGLVGKSGRAYGRYAGICFECEGYPDAMNAPAMGDILLSPSRPYHGVTRYAFSVTDPTGQPPRR